MVKNGYTSKPGYSNLRFFAATLAVFGSLFYYLYETQLYKVIICPSRIN